MKLENVVYHFFMKESGAKTMKLWVDSIKLTDNRENSLLKNKNILFDLVNGQFGIDTENLKEHDFSSTNNRFDDSLQENF